MISVLSRPFKEEMLSNHKHALIYTILSKIPGENMEGMANHGHGT